MSPRDDQSDAWIDLLVGIGKLASIEVPFQVIDGDQGDVQGKRQRLRGREAHDQSSYQARPCGHRDGAQVVQADPGLLQGLVDHGQELAKVRPCGDLRNHAAESLVQVDLRGDHARHDAWHTRAGGVGPSSTAAPVSSQVVSMASRSKIGPRRAYFSALISPRTYSRALSNCLSTNGLGFSGFPSLSSFGLTGLWLEIRSRSRLAMYQSSNSSEVSLTS